MVNCRFLLACGVAALAASAGLAQSLPGSAATDARTEQGSKLPRDKKYAQAAELWQGLLRDFPKDPNLGFVYHNLGVCALETGQFDLAIELFDKALGLVLETPEVTRWNLAIAYA